MVNGKASLLPAKPANKDSLESKTENVDVMLNLANQDINAKTISAFKIILVVPIKFFLLLDAFYLAMHLN